MAREMRVASYDPAWPARYEKEACVLRVVLGDVLIRSHHVGSTSVPGLPAKPIIDICLEVRGLGALDARNDRMRSLGYVPRGEFGIPGRRYFPKGGDDRTHHVHAYLAGDPNVGRHLAFRDYLRFHPAVAQAYAQVKREASAKHLTDSAGYQAYKNAFIARTLEAALAWAASDYGTD